MKAAVITCGIFLYSSRQNKLLVCHATNSPWNNWSVPKGLKDEGEDAYSAAIRELFEETGIDIQELNISLKHTLDPVKYQKQNKILESFLLVTDSDLSEQKFICYSLTEKGFPEVDKWKWVLPDEAAHLLHESQQKNIPIIKELIQVGK
ncbi:MAG TPA: NUDIX hydrolase [Bacteroidia bacterium]|nr:NUDIX hydrolase [Bacteroidia bacterium]